MNLSLSLLIALAALGHQEDQRKQVVAPIQPGVRPYAQMDRDIDAFVRREVRAESDADRIAAIEDLCGLFEELKRDPRLARSGVLQGYKAKVHG